VSAQVLRFPGGRAPLGYEELVAQLDLAVKEGRARCGTIYLLFATPGSKHHKDFMRANRAPSLERLRAELAKCAPPASAPPEAP
jgi:hypothetical protein